MKKTSEQKGGGGMVMDRIVLAAVWVICIPSLFLFFPRRRWREVVLLFIFAKLCTWTCSMILVETGFIFNPVREFPHASGSNFTFDYILYPTLTVFSCMTYPAGWWKRIVHHALFQTAVAVFLILVSRYTALIRLHGAGLWLPYMLFFIGFVATYLYGRWFFRSAPAAGVEIP